MARVRIPLEMWRDAVRFVFEGRHLIDIGSGEYLVINYEEDSAEYFKGMAARALELGWGEVERSRNGNLHVRLLGARASREPGAQGVLGE